MKLDTWYLKKSKFLTKFLSELFDGLQLEAGWAIWNDEYDERSRKQMIYEFEESELKTFKGAIYIKLKSGKTLVFRTSFDLIENLCRHGRQKDVIDKARLAYAPIIEGEVFVKLK